MDRLLAILFLILLWSFQHNWQYILYYNILYIISIYANCEIGVISKCRSCWYVTQKNI